MSGAAISSTPSGERGTFPFLSLQNPSQKSHPFFAQLFCKHKALVIQCTGLQLQQSIPEPAEVLHKHTRHAEEEWA